jgi:uncharacterized protein with beta-barrel porin domain
MRRGATPSPGRTREKTRRLSRWKRSVSNRIAQTVEIGAEDSEDEQGRGSGGGSEAGDDESGASSYSLHTGGLAISGLACCMLAYWL